MLFTFGVPPPPQVLGTPTREQIREMNPNYTEFKFPQIKAHPWTKVTTWRHETTASIIP